MPRKKILLVDDAAFMRALLGRMLTAAGYEIIGEAENGQMGIEKYKELKPDLAIVDVTMDILNGIECTRAIVKYDPNAKVIICSAMIGQEAFVDEAREAGATECILKPFRKAQTLEVVKRILGE